MQAGTAIGIHGKNISHYAESTRNRNRWKNAKERKRHTALSSPSQSSTNFSDGYYGNYRPLASTLSLGWTLRPQPNLCVTLTGLQIYAISPRAAPCLRPGLPWASMYRPTGFCRFVAVVDVVDFSGRCGRWLMYVVLAPQRVSNIKAQGERSEALGEAYNNFEPRQG